MDNFNLYSALAVIILGSILIPFVSKESIFNKILRTIGYVWLMSFVFFGDEIFGFSGVKWLLAISPGFAIIIYIKYKDTKQKT